MTQYTSGPWIIPPDDLIGQQLAAERGLRPVPWRAVVGLDNRVTCLVLTPPKGNKLETTANAHLITAAPELFAACKALVGDKLPADDPKHIDWNTAFKMAEAAIAKAERRPE